MLCRVVEGYLEELFLLEDLEAELREEGFLVEDAAADIDSLELSLTILKLLNKFYSGPSGDKVIKTKF